MTWRRGALLFFAALAGALIPLIPTVQVAGALTAPIELAGGLLRELSLSGPGGNVLAWAIVLLAAGLPLLLLVLPPNRGRRHWEDIFLPASSLLLIGLAFCAVNPSYLDRFFGSTLLIAAAVIWVSLLVFWGVLRLLRGMEEAPLERLSGVLRILLVGCAALLVFAAASRVSGAIVEINNLQQDWTLFLAVASVPEPSGLTGDQALNIALALPLVELIPDLLGAWMLLLAADLTTALARDPFGEESVGRCVTTARWSRLAIQATLVLALGVNLVKLARYDSLITEVKVSLDLPLIPLILSAALYLLCRCVQRGRELQEDNDSII
ncbi:MAG TPA: hypothetical protein H9989_02790 [Candidatus Lawsonibacter pullicola]|nr:hypothetical protein [Candidatus Lawsonibacter pullicola]